MARVTPTLQNFTSGELSEKLAGRYDLGSYFNGCSWLQNFVSTVQGPAHYRSGLRFAWNTRNHAAANLIDFEFNTEQAYVLEFTDQKLRIFRNGGLIVNAAKTITNITQANPAVVTSAAHGFSNGDKLITDDILGMIELNNQEFEIANVATDTFELVGVNSTAYTAYASGGTASKIVEVTTPYTAADIDDLDVAQSADTMYIAHPSYAPRKLTRSSHTSWTLATYSRTADPFTGSNEYPSVVTFFEQRIWFASSNNAPQKLWGSVAGSYDDFTTGTDDDDSVVYVVASEKVNRIRWMTGTEDFLAIGTAGGEFRASGGGELNAITPTNITIKPATYYGSAAVKPVRLDSHIIYIQKDSRIVRTFELDGLTGAYTSVNRTLLADHITETGIKQVAYQAGVPSICWAVRNDGKLVGLTFEPKEQVNGWHRHETDGLFESVATIPQEALPDQVWVVVNRTVGGVEKRFVEYFADQPEIPKRREFYTGRNNKAADKVNFLNALWEAQKQLFYVDSGLTYDGSDFASVALTLGALTGAGVTVTAAGAIFTASMVGRQIWAAGKSRATITAYTDSTHVTVTIIEDFTSLSLPVDGWYLTRNSLSGMQHLAGEDVIATADGGVVEGLTVSALGVVTLPNEMQASVINIGKGYTGILETMDVEGGGNNGASQTKQRNVNKVGVKFSNTLGASFGMDPYKLDQINFREASNKMDRPPPLFSGSKIVSVSDEWEAEKKIVCVQDKPLPCNIQLLMPYLTGNDG